MQHGLVGLAEILPALAVPDDHVRAPAGLDHRPGDLARERAFLGPIQVLRADADARALRGRTAAAMFVKGGQITISQCSDCLHQRPELLKKRVVSAGVLYIFQLPAIMGFLI